MLAVLFSGAVACYCPEQYKHGAQIANESSMEVLAHDRGIFFVLTGGERISRSQLRDKTLLHGIVLTPNVETRGMGTAHRGNCLRATESFTWQLGNWQKGPFNLGSRTLTVEYDGGANRVVVGGQEFDVRRGNYLLITLDDQWKPHTRQMGVVREKIEELQSAFAAVRAVGDPEIQSLQLYHEAKGKSLN